MNLKAPLLKDKKLSSEKLRIENKKMELRLQQLKLAMSKEKEERLSNGIQTNWSNGSPGALLNYKPSFSCVDSSKKIKLRMLKDENMIPEISRSNNLKANVITDIGGLDTVSSRNETIIDKNGSNFRSCGQCEENSAAVNCKECAEDYCPKCFAAFHLKGALRKHRSTPISTVSNRVSIPSPLFKPFDLKNMSNSTISKREKISLDEMKRKINFIVNESKIESNENSKENVIPKYNESSLADGNYNEEASNLYFQEAIYAWRNNSELSEPIQYNQKLPTIEQSTETVITKYYRKPLSDLIHFTPSMTYAEQLLLRKHRNNQLPLNEMKYVLSRLTRTNEIDILENQKLLQSNLILETSLINNNTENVLKDNQYHIDFDCVNKLLTDADLIEGRKPLIQAQITMRSPFKIEELLDHGDNLRCNELVMNNKLKQNESKHFNSNNSENYEITNLLDYKLLHYNNTIMESERQRSNMKSSKSVINKNAFYCRPISGRKLSARIDKGGKLTSKPSSLLNLLANFSSYLPYIEENNVSKAISKLSYNFYRLSHNSWKPSYSLLSSDYINEVHNFVKKNTSSDTFEFMDKEIENELTKLNLLSDEMKYNNTSVTSKSVGCNSSNVDEVDEETEEQETMNQLTCLDREITLISRQESDFSFNNNFQDSIFIDSLEISNQNQYFNSIDSDKFHFEDSLDFEQRYSNNSYTTHDVETVDEDQEISVIGNLRFDDFDDVNKLN